MKIGNARYGGESKKNYFKLKDGRSTFRILPPLGDLADDGRWSVFMSIHYGYKNSEGKMRTFQSPEIKNRKTKMIDSPDAAKNRITTGKALLEEAKKKGDKATEEQLFKLFGGQKPLYNLDSHHYMNVMDLQGNIGVLKIRHKAKLALDAVIKQLRAEGKDPLSVNDGRFFNFDRSGSGLDTVVQVSVYKETLDVQGVGKVERDLVHALTPEVIARLAREASELDKMAVKPTSEEVERIVKEGAKAVDEILDGKYGKNGGTSATDEIEPEGEESAAVAGTRVDSTPAQQAAAAASPAAAVQQTTQPTQAAVAPVQQAVAQAPAPVVTQAAPATQTTAQALNQQSDDDFLKSMGI